MKSGVASVTCAFSLSGEMDWIDLLVSHNFEWCYFIIVQKRPKILDAPN
jgi:hypothetical protein